MSTEQTTVEIPRIGVEPTLERAERDAMSALRHARLQPSMQNMVRAVDAWRLYQRMLAERFPDKGAA